MESDEYEHIKALIRGLHGPARNVARPPTVLQAKNSASSPDLQELLYEHRDRPVERANVDEFLDLEHKSDRAHRKLVEPHDGHAAMIMSPLRSHDGGANGGGGGGGNSSGGHKIITGLQVPTLIITDSDHSVAEIDQSHRRFSFGLRRHSQTPTILNRCESMGSFGYRAIIQYIETNDIQGLKGFLENRNLQIDDRDENGTSVLMVAAGKGLLPFVREFIARGADLQAEDSDNWTALLCAAKNGHLETVEILIEHGANLEHRDMGGWTALMWSSYQGHIEVVALLLEKSADFHAHGNYHLGPLQWAAGRGHTDICQMLVNRGAKVNVGDKYGTTALVWACRKGNAEIVDILLKGGANVDTAGMYSWTPLLVAVSGGHHECVSLLLERKPNVNALDKDGLTALSIACREGLQEIASALIQAGAYVNIQDRAGDTPLIHGVKGGHRVVVEALIKRHADVDIQGKDRKTAIYSAVEKGHMAIVKMILTSNPDLELATKDGDTPLLRAVRNRHLEIVLMLLERRAKVNAVDRRGDTGLHIAMRARSKAIVEALLRNPKNSQLLYRTNKAGETPYTLDTLHQKTILGQVFGARRLNTNEDSEGMLGYELYSSALADVLSEPTLTMPITVGLYAKWGSGKSFLLAKLRDEMKSFARQWAEPSPKGAWLLIMICVHIALLFGMVVGLITWSWLWASATSVIVIMLIGMIILLMKWVSRRYDVYWMHSLYHGLNKRVGRLRLIMQIAFCHPPGIQNDTQTMPVRFHFAEASGASPTGEGAMAHMLTSLFEAIEDHYGVFPTRLYRAFRPKPVKSSTGWRWRRMCCIPLIILFELGLIGVATGISLLIIYQRYKEDAEHNEAITLGLYILGGILLAGAVGNLHSWAKAFGSLFLSQRRHLNKALKFSEGAPLTALGSEVSLMADMVNCLDAFTSQQSRLVGVVDVLDSCDTERTLTILNAIQTLLSTPNRPFVLLLAVDPHVVAKAAEANSRRLFTEGGIGGHDFLRNLVHLPVYLQNSGLRKVQRAQNTAQAFRRINTDIQLDEPSLGHSASSRRLSNASEIMSSQEKLRAIPNSSRPGSKKLRLSESVASSIASNLHRVGQNPQSGALDLSKIILTDDYFSDVNPRSMRRLMNVIYITVRLLKAFQIDFSWYRLSSWINLTEQWPLRASMIVLQHDQFGESFEDTMPLQGLYEKVRPKISCLREAAPLLELDRDERKFDAFLQLHKSDLQVSDLRIFLPFTINLDPYIRKVLKEDQQAIEDEGIIINTTKTVQPQVRGVGLQPQNLMNMGQSHIQFPPFHNFYNPNHPMPTIMNYMMPSNQMPVEQTLKKHNAPHTSHMFVEKPERSRSELNVPTDVLQIFPQNLSEIRLSTVKTDGLVNLLSQLEELRPAIGELERTLNDNAISGRVLLHCDLSELKTILKLNFGHWELFRLFITTLRDIEKVQSTHNFGSETSDNVETNNSSCVPSIVTTGINCLPTMPRTKSQSVMEKQVTLEEQMICGALQTLNEEAFEDVVGSERPATMSGSTEIDNLFQQTGMQGSGYGVGGYYGGSASTCSSPTFVRRDSILKQPGCLKSSSDKRVSIKATDNDSCAGAVATTSTTAVHLEVVSEKKNAKNSGGRPASLVLIKGERPLFKLTRSHSFDDDNNLAIADAELTPFVYSDH